MCQITHLYLPYNNVFWIMSLSVVYGDRFFAVHSRFDFTFVCTCVSCVVVLLEGLDRAKKIQSGREHTVMEMETVGTEEEKKE